MSEHGETDRPGDKDAHGAERGRSGTPPWPECGGKSARILYGLIDPPPLAVAPELVHVLSPVAAAKAASRTIEEWAQDPVWKGVRAGESVLGGCVVGPWEWACRECGHEWAGDV